MIRRVAPSPPSAYPEQTKRLLSQSGGLKTLGDLVPYIPVDPPTVCREGEILQQVSLLTARQSSLALVQIDPDAHFVDDIGLG